MSKVVLVSCVSKKNIGRHKAKDLYASPLFRKAYKYAESLNPDKIFILSAKYHLLDPEKVVQNYNMTLNTFSAAKRKQWANGVLKQMVDAKIDLKNDELIFLAGKKYWRDIIDSGKIKNFSCPYFQNNLGGIGCIMKYLNENTK